VVARIIPAVQVHILSVVTVAVAVVSIAVAVTVAAKTTTILGVNFKLNFNPDITVGVVFYF
jgi:hypothetical protein